MNDWWSLNFPGATRIYGPPLLSSTAINHESLAAGLGELTFPLVFSGEDESFWFRDYALGGFCRTTSERVEILFKIIVGRAADESPLSARTAVLSLRDHSKKVVNSAKVILEVDPGYWKKHRRIGSENETVLSPTESCKRFAEEAVTMAEGRSLGLGEAFGVYTRYCHLHNATPLPKTEFSRQINMEIDKKFGVRLRHDLPPGEKGTRGWTKIALREEFLPIAA